MSVVKRRKLAQPWEEPVLRVIDGRGGHVALSGSPDPVAESQALS